LVQHYSKVLFWIKLKRKPRLCRKMAVEMEVVVVSVLTDKKVKRCYTAYRR